MLILKKITLINFLSHSKTELSFNAKQKLLIDGKSGSGKSSIVEGLVWCFYGKGRADNRSLIKRGKKSSKVVTDLYEDETFVYYRTERTITQSNKHSIAVFEGKNLDNLKPIKATGVKGVQEYLEKTILKSSYLLFINSIVYLQENVETFVRQTAAKRKDIILEMINSNNYDEYLKKSKKAIQENKLSLGITESKVDIKEKQIELDKEKSSNLEIYKEKKVEINGEILSVKEELKVVVAKYEVSSEKISLIKGKEDLILDLSNRINLSAEKIKEENSKIIALQTIDIEKLKRDVVEKKNLEVLLKDENEKRALAINWQERINIITQILPVEHDYDSDSEAINKKMIAIFGEEVPACIKCGTAYPGFEESKQSRIKELGDELSILNVKSEEHNKKKIEYTEAVNALGEIPEYNQTIISEYETSIITLTASENKLNELSGKVEIIKQIEENIKTINAEQIELVNKKNKLLLEISEKAATEKALEEINSMRSILLGKEQTLVGNNTENESHLALAEDAYNNIERNKKDIEELKSELISLKKDNNSLILIKDAFSPNGVKAIVIDYVIPQLEDKINNVLGKLSDFRVKLETQKSGATEGTVLEGLFITVINDIGEEFQFDNYSGGERLKIIVSISEALSEIQTIGFRVLDELFVGLDDESTESFTKVLMELQDRFSQMVCISHIRNIKDIFDDSILIIKNNGNSTIKKGE